jgi:hypothetical protein
MDFCVFAERAAGFAAGLAAGGACWARPTPTFIVTPSTATAVSILQRGICVTSRALYRRYLAAAIQAFNGDDCRSTSAAQFSIRSIAC